jgi:hypothetical protein
MNPQDIEIAELATMVAAAQEEFDMAVTFNEVWRPAVFDAELHERMGVSYATNAFMVIQVALRREVLLALVRLWDRDARAVSMYAIAATIRKTPVIEALAFTRATRIGFPEAVDQMRESLSQRADEALAIIDKYLAGGSEEAVLDKLRAMRNQLLAHRQTSAPSVVITDPTADEVEGFYQDMSHLIGLLMSLVLAKAYDPQETAGVYAHHARFFWAGVRGERSEGHPNFRPPPTLE